MKVKQSKWFRKKELAWLCLATLAVCVIPMASCYEVGGAESVRNDGFSSTSQVSSTVRPLVLEVVSESTSDLVRHPFPDKAALKRDGMESREKEIYRLALPNYDAGLATGYRDSISMVPMDTYPVFTGEGHPSGSSSRTAFVDKTPKITGVKRSYGSSHEQLGSLEYAYQVALMQLFSKPNRDRSKQLFSPDGEFDESVLYNNPFGDANPLKEAAASHGLENDPNPLLEDDSPSPTESIEPEPEPEPEPSKMNVSAGVRGNIDTVEEFPEGPLNFLVTGDFSQDGEKTAFRALRDNLGRFVLENHIRYTIAGGFLSFKKDEQVVTTDLNQDGLIDLVVVKKGLRDRVEIFEGKGGTRFDQWTSFSTSKEIIGISSFEFSGDGKEDLVFIVEDVPHLMVYKQDGSDFRYAKELVLPFEPGLLVEAQESPEERRLYIFNPALTEVVALSSENPSVYVSGLETVLDHLKTISVDGVLGGMSFLHLGGRVTLAEKTSGDVIFAGSFAAADQTPNVIFGGQRLMFVP
ncbi:MAG: VCBS repeat-containing protein [Acidobacteriota bacterium]|nr:VCBS repeat-containing protein [Acidobacteriota bacterium]